MSSQHESPLTLPPQAERSDVVSIDGLTAAEPIAPADLLQNLGITPYDVRVVRRSTFRDPIRTTRGTFYQETARYSDGAVRLATIGVPHKPRVPYPVSGGDSWFTGPDGFNQIELEQMVNDGYTVVWNHHHGRHSVAPTSLDHIKTLGRFLSSKSLGKSAAQDHALFDNLSETAGFNTEEIIRKGYSRSAMAGEAFIAEARAKGREVIWSDLEAACFARKVGRIAMAAGVLRQLPAELQTMGRIVDQGLHGYDSGFDDDDYREVTLEDYKGTLDFHPLNVAHELAWHRLLISGDAGKYAKAVPLDAKGVRTTYTHDYSGQQLDWQQVHADRPGIKQIIEDGSHLSGAEQRMLDAKRQRMLNLRNFLEYNDHDYSDLHYSYIVDGWDE